MKYEIKINRLADAGIEWSIKFEDNASNRDSELTVNVAKNLFDALQRLEAENAKPDEEYANLTRFQKGMLLNGDCLSGSLRV